MNILITGGTGFIGTRLALRCLQNKDQVFIIGKANSETEKQNIKLMESKGATVTAGSVLDKALLTEVTKGIDTVFHLAAAQHEANISDQIFYDINVNGTKNLIEASVASGVKRFVHGSTIGVYGNPDGPVNESSACYPVNIYGKTKLEGEKVVLSYKNKIPLVSIRISETYGPGDRRLLKLFKAIQKKVYFRIGSGKNLHQLIYIDDLIDGLLLAAESDKALGESILLVGSKPVSTDEMCDTIAEALNTHIPKIRAPLLPFTVTAAILETLLRPIGIQPPLHRRRMDFFTKSFSFSKTKALDLLEFQPKHSFKDGVAETARWYRENRLLSDNSTNNEHSLPKNMSVDPDLAAQIEPFDTFWEAPDDVEKGFVKFSKFYERNYLKFAPEDRSQRVLVISCGAGYMVDLLTKKGYSNVIGIDSDSDKVDIAKTHGLSCHKANAFPYLRKNKEPFDFIFAEQEINHLRKKEINEFLSLCRRNMTDNGVLFVHSLNGANPLTGSEALAQNVDHYNTFTEYSLQQILSHAKFTDIKVFPLKLYIFYENPINYVGMALSAILDIIFRIGFIFYGKDNKIFTKKIAAVCRK